MSQSRLAGCKRHRNWKGGWSGKETEEIEIAEKSELVEVHIRAEQEIYQGRGATDPQLGKQHPVRSIRILEFRTWKGLRGPGGWLLGDKKEPVCKEEMRKKRRNQKTRSPSFKNHRKAVTSSALAELRKRWPFSFLLSIW